MCRPITATRGYRKPLIRRRNELWPASKPRLTPASKPEERGPLRRLVRSQQHGSALTRTNRELRRGSQRKKPSRVDQRQRTRNQVRYVIYRMSRFGVLVHFQSEPIPDLDNQRRNPHSVTSASGNNLWYRSTTSLGAEFNKRIALTSRSPSNRRNQGIPPFEPACQGPSKSPYPARQLESISRRSRTIST